MNRKQKIIVSVTGIFLVLLILVGLTYAYFLTQITGNTNPKSISVTTANLIVRYEDGTNIILADTTKLKPSSEAIGTKTFKVVNEGDKADYVVIVDNISITDAATGVGTTFNTNDFVYTLECTSSDGNDCEDITDQTTLPLENQSILVGNNIEAGVTHTYTLTLWYLDNGEDQSKDMNKTLNARINIEDIRRINPYKDNTSSLAYNIIENSKNNINGTKLLSTADTPVAEDIPRYKGEFVYEGNSWNYGSYDEVFLGCTGTSATSCNEEMIGQYIGENCALYGLVTGCDSNGQPIIYDYTNEYESSLTTTADNYGTSYYYRGTVIDNYVNFADMCWRIVRIVGNGNIKLILEDQYTTCDSTDFSGKWKIGEGSFGYTTYQAGTIVKNNNVHIAAYLNGDSSPMANSFKNFQKKFNEKELDKMKSGDWCIADSAYLQHGTYGQYTYSLLNDIEKKDNIFNGNNIFYDSYVRLQGRNNKKASLKCNGIIMSTFEDDPTNPTPMYVGAITADEVVFAGTTTNITTVDGGDKSNFYLINESFKNNATENNGTMFWTLSLSNYDSHGDDAYYISRAGNLETATVSINTVNGFSQSYRPMITLEASTEIEDNGEGTQKKPYIIKMN